jgi:hypothetical protein
MPKPKFKPYKATKAEMLSDEIKDAIDSLHDIKNKKKRVEVAKDLIEYIQLHHIDYQGS